MPNTGDTAAYKTAIDKLMEQFEPQQNRLYEIYKFRKTNQQEDDTIDLFHTRLRSLAQSCEFANDQVDFEIMLQTVTGGTSSHHHKLSLCNPKLTLANPLLAGRCAEMSTNQAAEMETSIEPVSSDLPNNSPFHDKDTTSTTIVQSRGKRKSTYVTSE